MGKKLRANNVKFGFEDLEVWQKAINFADKVIDIGDKLNNTNRKHYRLVEQLESSATSIAMNIAEDKGRYSKREFIQFLYIARGSLYETITLLMILHKKNWIDGAQLDELKGSGSEVGRKISNLINSIKNSMS
jgi:four helix bundle protein